MLTRTRKILPACLVAALAFGIGAAHADTLAGTWKAKQARFHYSGFTSQYTCDGLRSKVKTVLVALGARDDVKVEGSCGGRTFNEPQMSQSVVIGFAVAVPAEGRGSPGETFPVEWRVVQLRPKNPTSLAWGDCELVEQLREQVLPLFNPRDVKDNTTCTPHQVNVGSPDLRVTVLMPVPAGPPANAVPPGN